MTFHFISHRFFIDFLNCFFFLNSPKIKVSLKSALVLSTKVANRKTTLYTKAKFLNTIAQLLTFVSVSDLKSCLLVESQLKKAFESNVNAGVQYRSLSPLLISKQYRQWILVLALFLGA